MQNFGYVQLYRKTLNNPIVMKDSDHLAVWVYLLLNATHKEQQAIFKGEKITLKKGELITGILSISKKLVINKDKVQRILKLLESDKQITQQTSNKGRLISIVNWPLYQNSDKQNDKQLINNCETTDKQLITNNNDNNVNNVINTYYYLEQQFGRFLTPVEYEKILKWQKWFNDDVINYAIDITIMNGARALSYTEAIINSWHDKGYKNLEDCKNEKTKERELSEIFEYDWLNEE